MLRGYYQLVDFQVTLEDYLVELLAAEEKATIRTTTLTLLKRTTIEKLGSPASATPLRSRRNPMSRPKTTMINIGEYFVPATTGLAIRRIGTSKIKNKNN